MDAYLDASCLVTLAIRDAHWPSLTGWFGARRPSLVVSDFGVGELTSAIGLQVRSRLIAAEAARMALEEAKRRFSAWRNITITSDDIAAATGYVADFSLAHRLPDAIHIVAARRLGATLLTTDRGQAGAAAALDVAAVDPVASSKESR